MNFHDFVCTSTNNDIESMALKAIIISMNIVIEEVILYT